MANIYQIQRNSKVLGQFTSTQLREMASSGQLFENDLIRKLGSDEKWLEISRVKSLGIYFQQDSNPKVPSTLEYELNESEEKTTSFYAGQTDQRKADLANIGLPMKVRELIHDEEEINYASRPSKAALVINMIVYGVLFGIISIGVLIPIALLLVYLSWKNTYYVITDGRTIVMRGIFNVATKMILNKNIQLISINTGIVDRWLKLNSVELTTAAQSGSGILAFFPGMSGGGVTLRQVEVTDVIKNYAQF